MAQGFDIEAFSRHMHMQSAEQRAAQDGMVRMGSKTCRIPDIVLMARDVMLFSIYGIATGYFLDYVFSFIPGPDVAADLGVILLQLLVNSGFIFAATRLYTLVWARNPDTYIGYTIVITIMILCQVRFAERVRAINVLFTTPIHPLN